MKQVWRHIEEDKVSASYGLASDEFLMNSQARPENPYPVTLKLYTYKNYSALCGRFQNINAEIDLESCVANGFDYGRRLTGGGAIIMGENQLGICLTSHSKVFEWTHIRDLYHLFAEPLIQALQTFNIQASFRSKNDIEVNGKKIAGLGIHVSPDGSIQFHCSLLLDLDIPQMLKVLKIPAQKFDDKAMIQNVGQRMTTVRGEAENSISMRQLKDAVLQGYESLMGASLVQETFTAEDRSLIADLERNRYRSKEWLFQNSPLQDMDGMGLKKTKAGLLRTYIGLKGESIKSVLITGDFLNIPKAFQEIELQLKWSPFDKYKITEIVNNAFASFPDQDSSISAEDVVEAIWLAAQRAFSAKKYTYQGSCYYPKVAKDV